MSIMPWGLLWYDGDPKRPLEEKVRRAATRYVEKYGRKPNRCFVHPEAVGDESVGTEVNDCKVITSPTVLRHHFWIGEVT